MSLTIEQEQSRRPAWLVGGGLLVIVLGIGFVVARQQLMRPPGEPLPVISGIHDFCLTNQLGQKVTLSDLRGHVTVADVIFTRCPSSCLVMSHQFAQLQKKLPADGSVRLLSMTIDPEFDTPRIMKEYGDKLGNDPAKWWLLTGDNKVIHKLAIDDFKFVVVPKDAASQASKDDLFIHSTYFMLLDQRARVRAVIESTEPGAMEKTLELANQLRADT